MPFTLTAAAPQIGSWTSWLLIVIMAMKTDMSDFTVLIMASHRWIVRSIIIFPADEGWDFSTYVTYPNSCTVET